MSKTTEHNNTGTVSTDDRAYSGMTIRIDNFYDRNSGKDGKVDFTRLDAPRGSYLAMRTWAHRLADKLAEKANSPLELLYLNCKSALDEAIKIVLYSREGAPDVRNYMESQVRLVEYVARSTDYETYQQWPKSPGHSLGWRTGDSALHTAFLFSSMISGITTYIRRNRYGLGKMRTVTDPKTGGRVIMIDVPDCRERNGIVVNCWTALDLLPVVPEPDPAFLEWMGLIINEICTDALPPVDKWTKWDIHCHADTIRMYMKEELKLALAGSSDSQQDDQPTDAETVQYKGSGKKATKDDLISAMLVKNPSKNWTAKAVADEVGCVIGTVRRNKTWKDLSKMRSGNVPEGSKYNGKVDAVDDGNFEDEADNRMDNGG